MAENAIAIPINVATIPVAGFTLFPSVVQSAPFLPLAGFSLPRGVRNPGPDGAMQVPWQI
jgi:hypothetical protein